MIEVTAKRTFLRGQKKQENGARKDILCVKGQKYQMEHEEAIKFWGALDIKESDKKKLMEVHKRDHVGRVV